ncbi:hypothetical protein NEA10_19440 [Phormidium yuhuli AB48]|uniref:Uncharacterized protein n=1 Tax=Phormidium yuhuli AB48 TaxID=2940671 RepID=A0ABY5ARX4_9CYAN|nr:hypothetical protein [Phormidium yuhuli]USR90969.1 hypothetical protein NEA10_19440 [Phormidium yuhuli AB48]
MSQTPPPSEDQQSGLLRSLLIGVLRRLIALLERWLVRLETPEAAEPLPLWQNPLLWLGTIAAVGLALVVVLPQGGSQPTEIARQPAPLVEPTPIPEPPQVPVSPAPSLEDPEPSPTAPEPPAVAEAPELDELPEPSPEPSPELSPEPLPESLPEPALEAPTPEPRQLTPEQQLVAAVRSQISDVARPYERCYRSGLNLTQQENCTDENRFVKRISANFEADLLRVEITPQWYTLDGPERTQLANGLWTKAQRLDFSHVEIVDDQGILVARSPVVGNDVIILRRSRYPSPGDAPN